MPRIRRYLTPVKRYSDNELEAIISNGESERVEFKATWTRTVADKARQTVCAFANDLGGTQQPGILIVGLQDNGSAAGISVDDRLLLTLNELRTDGNIVPPPSLYVEKRAFQGAQIAVVVVSPSDSPPVRYDGRIHVRTGPRRDIATEQDERILRERRRSADVPTDLQPARSATVENINKKRFELEYLPAAFHEDILAANHRTYEQRLSALKMVQPFTPFVPTITGCLALIDEATWHLPQAHIQWLRIDGITLADPKIDELICSGHIAKQAQAVDGKLTSFNRVEVDYANTDLERRHTLYPVRALQQLVRNALLHRDYAAPAPIHVYWYNDRIEITSPGGPYGLVNIDNFGEPGIVSYRNLTLAEAMKVLNLVQHFGTGILIARQLCAENGNPPIEFQVTQSYVRAIVRSAVRPW